MKPGSSSPVLEPERVDIGATLPLAPGPYLVIVLLLKLAT